MTTRWTGSTAADNRLLCAVKTWAEAREARLRQQRSMRAFHCERESRDDFEVGDIGVTRCYRSGHPKDDWCESCRQRNALYDHWWILKRIEKNYYYGLLAFLRRRESPEAADAVDPVEGVVTK